MKNALHFVGFVPGTIRYARAVAVFGQPDIIHRVWDYRARVEIMEGDVAIFADGDENSPINKYSYDDSNNTGDQDDVHEPDEEY